MKPDGKRAPVQAAPIAGRYELVEQLDAGGMGQIWRGYDGVLDREVAVKLIRTDVISSQEQADRRRSGPMPGTPPPAEARRCR